MFLKFAMIVELISAVVIILPPISMYYYLVGRTGRNTLRFDIVLLSIYSILFLYVQTLIAFCSFKHVFNLYLFHIFIPVEFFFFIYILVIYSGLDPAGFETLTLIVCGTFLVHYLDTFDSRIELPYITSFVEFIVVLVVAPYAIKESLINNSDLFKIPVIKGILFTVTGNFAFVTLIKIYTTHVPFIHAGLNIYANLLFAKAFKNYAGK